ncbi:unnamed protein product, partial [marine sediment metagenome]
AIFTARFELQGVNAGRSKGVFLKVDMESPAGQPEWATAASAKNHKQVGKILFGAAMAQGHEPPDPDTSINDLVALWNELMVEGATYKIAISHYGYKHPKTGEADWVQKVSAIYPA